MCVSLGYIWEGCRLLKQKRQARIGGKSKSQVTAFTCQSQGNGFYRQVCLLYINLLHERRCRNAGYYCKILNEVGLTYHRERHYWPVRDLIVLQDNACSHTATQTQQTWSYSTGKHLSIVSVVQTYHPVSFMYLVHRRGHMCFESRWICRKITCICFFQCQIKKNCHLKDEWRSCQKYMQFASS